MTLTTEQQQELEYLREMLFQAELNEVIFKSNTYYLPGDTARAKKDRFVDRAELINLVKKGAKWEQLEQYYQISKTNLISHFEADYNQAQAELQIKLVAALAQAAIDDKNTALLKWLSTNWLGMSESSKITTVSEQLSPEEIDRQLNAIINK